MSIRAGNTTLGLRQVLLIVAVICFILVTIGIDLGVLRLEPLGLAAFAGSFLVR
jgi:hypothetical protein